MESVGGMILTVVAGAIVAVFGLILEYRYFKRHRSRDKVSQKQRDETAVDTPWSRAVDVARERLRRDNPISAVSVVKMLTRPGVPNTAVLHVLITSGPIKTNRYVKIDMAGDILEECPWDEKSF
jgi:hypothetical protein